MTPLGVFARGTSGQRTPDAALLRVADDGRGSLSVLRALALLVSRLARAGVQAGEQATEQGDALLHAGDGAGAGTEPTEGARIDSGAVGAVRDALRQLSARARERSLLLRVADGELLLHGTPLASNLLATEPAVASLVARLMAEGIGSITVREGAAPGELLTLARWLADDRPHHEPQGRELLRTWSILVMPIAALQAGDSALATSATALARLAASRSDDAASSAVGALLDVLEDAAARGDAMAAEGVARACMTHLRVVAGGGGRLALERLIRRMLQPALLELLAERLPESQDPAALLQLFARAGDVGVQCLLAQLLSAEDSVARRVYFDSIVAMDVGAALLFETLNDTRWFVVRNAAALLGEMGVEQADAALLPLLGHADDRIRIAAGRALIRLRTVPALAGLHQAVGDANPEVRRLSAAAYGISGGMAGRARPAASALAAALDRETDDDVALEMLAALGRLGSSQAVQRLLRIALPSVAERGAGERPPPRDAWMRIAAMEALVQARGHAMIPAIESLTSDADPEVASAAVRTLGARG